MSPFQLDSTCYSTLNTSGLTRWWALLPWDPIISPEVSYPVKLTIKIKQHNSESPKSSKMPRRKEIGNEVFLRELMSKWTNINIHKWMVCHLFHTINSKWSRFTLGQEPGCICTLHSRMQGIKEEIFLSEMELLRADRSRAQGKPQPPIPNANSSKLGGKWWQRRELAPELRKSSAL